MKNIRNEKVRMFSVRKQLTSNNRNYRDLKLICNIKFIKYSFNVHICLLEQNKNLAYLKLVVFLVQLYYKLYYNTVNVKILNI